MNTNINQDSVADLQISEQQEKLREQIAQLTPAQRAMLTEKLNAKTKGKNIPRLVANAQLQLSSSQLFLWLHNQIIPGDPLYITCCHATLRGMLDMAALTNSLQTIIDRHDILRARFASVDGMPVQTIAPPSPLSLPIVDLCNGPVNLRQENAEKLIYEDAYHAFDFSNEPLVRMKLLQLADDEYILMTTFHHIIFDGWSAAVFYQELADCYRAKVTGQPCPLSPMPIQFYDYAAWEQQQLSEDFVATELSYWRNQLDDAPELLLPRLNSTTAVYTHSVVNMVYNLPSDIAEGILALSRQQACTPFMVMLAAFACVLSRYSGQDDLLLSTSVVGRTKIETEPLIGPLVNIVALRLKIDENPTVADLLNHIKTTIQDVHAHQEVSYDKVIETIRKSKKDNNVSLMDAHINFRRFPVLNIILPGLTIERRLNDRFEAPFDLMLDITVKADTYSVCLCYNEDCFSRDTINRMSGHLQVILAAMTKDANQTIRQLPILTEAEKQQILIDWNATDTPYPDNHCIHQLFEEQAAKTPDAIAVITAKAELTYRQLNEKANQVAHHLRRLGVGPDMLVGICTKRTPDAIVGIMGILKAGGAYAPLAYDLPMNRLTFMMQDMNISLLLTHNTLLERLPIAEETTVICLDTDWPVIATESKDNLPINIKPDNLAYIIYTSGSTGQPKGALITHRSICNLAPDLIKKYNMTSASRKLQFSPISFDASVADIFCVLFSGASLYIYSSEATNSSDIMHEIAKAKVTVSLMTPAVLASYADREDTTLKTLIVGGEDCPIEVSTRWRKGRCLISAYGPSEATVISTLYTADDAYPGHLPIGKPIANCRVYVLDKYMQPVPVGISGELFISGVGVGRGYLNRPDLTLERFLPDPFSKIPGTRMYRSGDLVRWLPDGNLEFAGRTDTQVKIRGFRIEPQEIEAVATAHEEIREAMVIPLPDERGELALVMYIVPEAGKNPTTRDIQLYMRNILPDYMVPVAIVTLQQFPLNANGKIDRKALPSPNISMSKKPIPTPPRTLLELQIAQIWERVLKVTDISVTDNFFALGGHSLLVMQMLTQIEKNLGYELPATQVMKSPTVAQLAEFLSQDGYTPSDTTIFTFNEKGTQPPFIVVTPGTALMFRELALKIGNDQPLVVLQFGAIAHMPVPQIAEQQIQELRAHGITSPYRLGGFCSSGLVAFAMAQQLMSEGEEVPLLALFDTMLRLPDSLPVRILKLCKLIITGKVAIIPHLRKIISRYTTKITQKLQPAEVTTFDKTQMNFYTQAFAYIKNNQHMLYKGRIDLFIASEVVTDWHGTNPDLGWARVAQDRIDIHQIPGSHLTIMRGKNVEVLAEKLLLCLKQPTENDNKNDME